MTRILESDNNIEGQRVSPGLSRHVSGWYQVGWTSCKPSGYFTKLGTFLLSSMGIKLALKARQAGKYAFVPVSRSPVLAQKSENASLPIRSRPSTP